MPFCVDSIINQFINIYKSFLSSLYLFCLAFLTRLHKFTHLYVFIDICDQLLFKNFFIKTYKSSSFTFNNILKSRFIRNYISTSSFENPLIAASTSSGSLDHLNPQYSPAATCVFFAVARTFSKSNCDNGLGI
ncbi:unnamed protein product [Brassica oleracea var. botrytis]